MSNMLFSSVITAGALTGSALMLTTISSLLIGIYLSFIYSKQGHYSQSFLITLAMLPATVQLVIMLVNGNVGAGVAVAGAFSLVRFRSTPGSGQEITGIFIAMAVGLATGMGYIAIAALFAILLSGLCLVLSRSNYGVANASERVLRITIPEGLDYDRVFDGVLSQYTSSYELVEVKTASMGSLFKLSYNIVPKDDTSIRAMIDDLRVRNGNLEISCSRPLLRAEAL